MKNRNWLLLFLVATTIIPFVSCTKDPNTAYLGNWITQHLTAFGGVPRSNACAFVIGDTVYVGLGQDADNHVLDDWWKWGVYGSTWLQVDSMRGANKLVLPGRESAVAFSIGDSLGYVGTGSGLQNFPFYNDFYSYNPKTNKWTTLENFPGSARSGCVGFGIGKVGIVGAGFDLFYHNDFYKYDPNPNLPAGSHWTKKPISVGDNRVDGGVFIIGSKAYILTGGNGTSLCIDMVIYDSNIDKFRVSDTSITNTSVTATHFNSDYTNIARQGACLFAINGKGYVTWGLDNSSSLSIAGITWEYDPSDGLWTRKTTFPTNSNVNSLGAFGIGVSVPGSGKAFIGTGEYTASHLIDNFYEFLPETEYIPGD